MEIIKKFKKSEKGSITVMVLTSMLFMLVVITASYLSISNESIGQNKKVSQISEQYQVTDEEMEQKFNKVLNESEVLDINQVKSIAMFEKTTNTETEDAYGNKIMVPARFKVIEDTNYVTEGIVIEDKEGNQFVWVPVGDIYTDVERTETNKKKIELGRYDFVKNEDGTVTTSEYNGDYTEDTVESHNSEYGNAIAKDIEEFKASVHNNGGYYIGRYEAGVTSGILDISDIKNDYTAPKSKWTGWSKEDGTDAKMVCKQGQQVWNYVTQPKASELSQSMYASDEFTSDLTNSYAWDTAIVFIQIFGKESNSKTYSHQLGKSTDTTNFGITGKIKLLSTSSIDKQCNIFDMAGDCWEWSTETKSDKNHPCIYRGGGYCYEFDYTSVRYRKELTNVSKDFSFRPIIYINN